MDVVRIYSRLTEQMRESAFYRAEKEGEGLGRVGESVGGGVQSKGASNRHSNNGQSHSNNNGNESDVLNSQYEALLHVFNEENDDEDDDDDDGDGEVVEAGADHHDSG